MFAPPSGYQDLLADADDVAPAGVFRPVHVEDVGLLELRKPQPRSAAALAMTVNTKADRETQIGYLNVFVSEHLPEGVFGELLIGMVREELPADTVQLVAKAVATLGTARPYNAVAALAGLTGHHWRTVRAHLLDHGIAHPLALPNMHTLLDVVETMAIEATQSEKPAETRRKRTELIDALYKPDLTAKTAAPTGPPAGFGPDEVEDAFDSFTRSVR